MTSHTAGRIAIGLGVFLTAMGIVGWALSGSPTALISSAIGVVIGAFGIGMRGGNTASAMGAIVSTVLATGVFVWRLGLSYAKYVEDPTRLRPVVLFAAMTVATACVAVVLASWRALSTFRRESS